MGEAKRKTLAQASNTHDRVSWKSKCRLLSELASQETTLVSGRNSTVVKRMVPVADKEQAQ